MSKKPFSVEFFKLNFIRNRSLRFIVQSSIIAAIYITITLIIAPISSGLTQLRVSEALTLLPCFTPAAIPGLFVGCFLANLITGAFWLDIIFGSLATLMAATLTYFIYKYIKAPLNKWLAPLPPVMVNAFVVGWILFAVYDVGVPYWHCAISVGIGQFLACYAIGLPFMSLLEKHRAKIFK